MPLSDQEAAQRARDILTEQSEAVMLSLPKIIGLIPTVLEDFARAVASNPRLRRLQRTAALDVMLTNGVTTDLHTVINTNNILEDFLETAEITLDAHAIKYALRLVGSLEQLRAKSFLDPLFILGYLEGTTLYVKNPDDSALDTLNGTLKLKASYLPTISQIHESLEGMFVQMLADASRAEVG